jgi:hypothetical protein
MFKLYFLLSAGLMLQVCRACDEENQLLRQQSDEYFASAYEFNRNLGMFHPMVYESSARVPGKNLSKMELAKNYLLNTFYYLEFYASPYEGRTPFTRPKTQSFNKQFSMSE